MVRVLAIVLAIALLGGCNNPPPPKPPQAVNDHALSTLSPTPGETAMPEPEPDALWRDLQDADYRNWSMWPGKEALYPTESRHFSYLTTYVNPAALKAIEAGTYPLPDGATVVKENYDENKQLKVVSVMFKVAGYNPGGGDWYWAEYTPDGSVSFTPDGAPQAGKPVTCFVCHSQAEDEYDFLMTPFPGSTATPAENAELESQEAGP